MNGKEFAASLVSSLAWPVVAVILGVLFRNQLRLLLEQPLKRLKAGPFEAEWENGVAKTAVDAASGALPRQAAGNVRELASLKARAKHTPVPVVRDSYELVSQELRRIGRDAKVEKADTMPISELTETLKTQGHLNDATASAVDGLVTLRNLTAHDDGSGLSVTPARAGEYVALVEATLFALSRVSTDS